MYVLTSSASLYKRSGHIIRCTVWLSTVFFRKSFYLALYLVILVYFNSKLTELAQEIYYENIVACRTSKKTKHSERIESSYCIIKLLQTILKFTSFKKSKCWHFPEILTFLFIIFIKLNC